MKPLYKHSLADAKQYSEGDDWLESHIENVRCRIFLDDQIKECFKDNHLSSEGIENTVKAFGYDRTMWVIANTITMRIGDERFHRQNSDWAKSFAIPNSNRNYEFALNSHSCLVDGLADQVRRMYRSLAEEYKTPEIGM